MLPFHISPLSYNTFSIVVLSPPYFRGIHLFTKKKKEETCYWIDPLWPTHLSSLWVWRNICIDCASVLSGFFLPPAVVSVRSVGFGHLVQLVLLLDDVALLDWRCQQFLGKFFIHVCASVFVVPALRDHPFHGEEAPSVVRKRDGHLGDQTEYNT